MSGNSNQYDVVDEKPLRKCVSDGQSYCSTPPKLRCARCGQSWIEYAEPPTCHYLERKDICDLVKQQTQDSEERLQKERNEEWKEMQYE